MSGDCFSKLPLYGKIFYLDTPSYKHNKQLQSRLKRLGATIEPFLTNSITYFVTDTKQECKSKNEKDLNESNTCQTPFPYQIQTRAYKMMSKITPNPKESTVQRARRLKLNVQPLNKVLFWLLDIEKAQNKSWSKSFDVTSKRHKFSSLKGFFIKVEDLSRFNKTF
nr:protein DBF4 homolog A [Hydra vulgaris]